MLLLFAKTRFVSHINFIGRCLNATPLILVLLTISQFHRVRAILASEFHRVQFYVYRNCGRFARDVSLAIKSRKSRLARGISMALKLTKHVNIKLKINKLMKLIESFAYSMY
jgi:hypothetical protein